MKRMLSALMAAAICVTFGLTAAAADAGQVSVSFDTVEDIMLQNSLDLRKIKADLEKAKGDYYDLQNGVDDLKDLNAVVPSVELTAEYNTLKTSRDTAEIYYLTLQTQYDKSVMLQVLKARQLYLTYATDLMQEEVLETQLANKKLETEACSTKLKLGFMTKNQFDLEMLDLKTVEDSLDSQRQKTASDYKSLKAALGVPEGTELDVLPMTYDEEVFPEIPLIDFDEDSAAMLQSSVDIKSKEIALQIKQTATIKKAREINVAKVELEQAKDSAAQSFRAQYDAVTDAYRSYETAREAYTVKEAAAKSGEMMYQYGYLSKLQLNDLELSRSMAQLSQTAQKNSLYLTYLRYAQMKNGD